VEYHKGEYSTGKELVFMSKHLNPLEKEFLIRQYKSNYRIKMSDFCAAGMADSVGVVYHCAACAVTAQKRQRITALPLP
jgi:hypothetical protein